ncbi:MAG: DoxX-like family protein [Bacteroidia bacterium]
MLPTKPLYKFILNIAVALIWLINGLFCKLLNFVPRHQEIVGCILGDEHSFILIKIIGALEVLMAIWIVSGFWPHLCAILQIILILVMNFIEVTQAPDLLLFGPANIFPAILLVSVIYFNDRYTSGKKEDFYR